MHLALPMTLLTSSRSAKYPSCCLPLQRGVVDTQLIAHDKEVYDIAWGGPGVFASVSADGSVRVFDLRYGESTKNLGVAVIFVASTILHCTALIQG